MNYAVTQKTVDKINWLIEQREDVSSGNIVGGGTRQVCYIQITEESEVPTFPYFGTPLYQDNGGTTIINGEPALIREFNDLPLEIGKTYLATRTGDVLDDGIYYSAFIVLETGFMGGVRVAYTGDEGEYTVYEIQAITAASNGFWDYIDGGMTVFATEYNNNTVPIGSAVFVEQYNTFPLQVFPPIGSYQEDWRFSYCCGAGEESSGQTGPGPLITTIYNPDSCFVITPLNVYVDVPGCSLVLPSAGTYFITQALFTQQLGTPTSADCYMEIDSALYDTALAEYVTLSEMWCSILLCPVPNMSGFLPLAEDKETSFSFYYVASGPTTLQLQVVAYIDNIDTSGGSPLDQWLCDAFLQAYKQ